MHHRWFGGLALLVCVLCVPQPLPAEELELVPVMRQCNRIIREVAAMIAGEQATSPLLGKFDAGRMHEAPETRRELEEMLGRCGQACAPWTQARIDYQAAWFFSPEDRQKLQLLFEFSAAPCRAVKGMTARNAEFFFSDIGLYLDVLVRHTDLYGRPPVQPGLEQALMAGIRHIAASHAAQELSPSPGSCVEPHVQDR